MSAQQCFALCIDCWEMHYGISDSNGVYSRDSGSSNHFDHAVHVFGTPNNYPPPIRTVLASLQGRLPVSNGRMELFSLACAVEALQPTNGVRVSPSSAPVAVESIFPDQTCIECGIEHPGLPCSQPDLFGEPA